MTDFDKLKAILLKDENEELRRIKNELIKIDKEEHSPELIIDKISPLLSSIINKSSIYNKEILLEAFSPIVLELVDQSYEKSSQKVAKQLAPLISIAIKEQIKSHKNEVVDALYPVIGNMISRYVSKTFEEMINSINQQIKSGLSLKVLTRKLKAKIKGVSEADLLLSENISSNIKSVFLIHKESGIVLSHVEHPNNPINEPEMLASMMTAIRSFVNDWVDKNDQFKELGTIEYGGSKILIEASGSSYLAVIIDGSSTLETSNRIREVLENITYKYSDEIKNFEGDTSTIPTEDFYNMLSTLITKKEENKEQKKLHPLIYLLPILLLAYLLWYFYLAFIDKNISTKANEILYKTPSLTLYRLETKVKKNILTLSGEVPSLYYKELAQKRLEEIKEIKKIENNLIIVEVQNVPFLIEQRISYLFLALNTNKNIDIKYEYKHPSLKVEGSVWTKEDETFVLSQIKNIQEIQEIQNNILIKSIKDDPFLIEQKISYLFLALNTNKNIDIRYEYKHPFLKIEGSVWSSNDKVHIFEQLKNIKELKNIKDNIKVRTPKINSIIYFKKNSSKILATEEYKLINIIILLQKLDKDLILNVTSYRDETGTKEKNELIVKNRANNIARYLKTKGRVLQKINAIGVNETPPNIDLEKNPEKARQAVFSWQK